MAPAALPAAAPCVRPAISSAIGAVVGNDDCSGAEDDNALDALTWYLDADADGFGGTSTALACEAPPDHTAVPGDCDDAVPEVFPGGTFKVKTEAGTDVHAHLAGKLRRFRIRVVLGDRVTVAVSPYDLTKGRIVFRHK